MNYRERIRKAIECPQFGDETYGEWGVLNLEQRKFIKRLLDELDRADNYIKQVYLENQELKKQLEELEKENFNLRENIYINKISFSSEGKNIKELIGMPTYEDLINQQKEFIEYLEDLIKQNETVVEVSKYGLPKNCSKLLIDFYKEILQKYKEIIGDVK